VTSYQPNTIDNPSQVDSTMGDGKKARQEEKTIHEAVQWGDFDRVKEILEKDPEAVNSRADIRESRFSQDYPRTDMTALHVAVRYNREEIAEHLISKGADIRAIKKQSPKSIRGITPFMQAALDNKTDFVKMLLKHGIEVDTRDPVDNTTLLHVAASHPRLQCVEILLEAGADVNARSKDGWTPLHNAAINGNIFITELLISRGADINAQVTAPLKGMWEDSWDGTAGDTSLHLAARERKYDTVSVLLNHGASVTLRNTKGETPMQLAQEAWRGDSMVELLLQFGAIAEPMIAPPDDQPEQKTSYPPYQSQERVFKVIYGVIDDTINNLLVPAAEEHILDKEKRDDFLHNAQRMLNFTVMVSLIDELEKIPYHPEDYNITNNCRLAGDFRMTLSDENERQLYATAEVCHKTVLENLIKAIKGGGSR